MGDQQMIGLFNDLASGVHHLYDSKHYCSPITVQRRAL